MHVASISKGQRAYQIQEKMSTSYMANASVSLAPAVAYVRQVIGQKLIDAPAGGCHRDEHHMTGSQTSVDL